MGETHEPTMPQTPVEEKKSDTKLADEELKVRKKRKLVPVHVYKYGQPPNPVARMPVMMADGKTPREWTSTAEADAWCGENIDKAGRYSIVTVQRDFEITVKQETVVTRV